MFNLFEKTVLLYHINKSKDSVGYHFYKDIADGSSLHRVTIDEDAFVSVEMHRDSNLNTHFGLRYYFPDGKEYNIRPCQQSRFDKFVISKMYSKMLNNYIAKNGMPDNSR